MAKSVSTMDNGYDTHSISNLYLYGWQESIDLLPTRHWFYFSLLLGDHSDITMDYGDLGNFRNKNPILIFISSIKGLSPEN